MHVSISILPFQITCFYNYIITFLFTLTCNTLFAEMAHPELLDPAIDQRHRSYLTAVEGAQLGTFRPRSSRERLLVHDSFVERYGFTVFTTPGLPYYGGGGLAMCSF